MVGDQGLRPAVLSLEDSGVHVAVIWVLPGIRLGVRVFRGLSLCRCARLFVCSGVLHLPFVNLVGFM